MLGICPTVKIYVLKDPDSGEIRYVGKTIQKLKYRLASHYCRQRNYKQSNSFNHTEAWVSSLRNQGKKPTIELLEEVEFEYWIDKERYYIQYFKDLGFNLTNHSVGGDKCNLGCRWKCNEDFKRKISEKHSIPCVLINIVTDETIEFKSFKEASLYAGVSDVWNHYKKGNVVKGMYKIFKKQ